jgi:hypothetical protein
MQFIVICFHYIAIYRTTKGIKSHNANKAKKKFSDIEIGRILQLHDDKMSYGNIGKQFGVFGYTISRLITRLRVVYEMDLNS